MYGMWMSPDSIGFSLLVTGRRRTGTGGLFQAGTQRHRLRN
jgi:hypothetical protein